MGFLTNLAPLKKFVYDLLRANTSQTGEPVQETPIAGVLSIRMKLRVLRRQLATRRWEESARRYPRRRIQDQRGIEKEIYYPPWR